METTRKTRTYDKPLSSQTVGSLIEALERYPADAIIDVDLLNMESEVVGTAAYLAVEFESTPDRRVIIIVAHPDV